MPSRRTLLRILLFAPSLLVSAYIGLASYKGWIHFRHNLILLLAILLLTIVLPLLARTRQLRKLFRRRLWKLLVSMVPLLLMVGLFLAARENWIHLDLTSIKLVELLIVALAIPPAIMSYKELWQGTSDEAKVITSRTPDFPYNDYSPAELPLQLTNLAHSDIPYVPRLPAAGYDAMLKTMREAQFILLVGRTGLGKTREAVEFIRRLEEESGEEISVLVPNGTLEIPWTRVPADKLKRRVVLFLDDLPARYLETQRVDDLNRLDSIADDFRYRFERTIQRFSDQYGAKFRVVSTAIGEPNLRERLRLSDPFWKKFTVYDLPGLAPVRIPDALDKVGLTLGLEVTQGAKLIAQNRTDGTFGSLIVPLIKEQVSNANKKRLAKDDAKKYNWTYPQEWEQEVYHPVFRSNVYRRNLLAALDIIRQARMVPFEFVASEIAVRLSSKHLLFLRRRLFKRSLKEVRDWVPVLADGRLSCAPAYLDNKGDLAASINQVVSGVSYLMGSRDRLLKLRPSLYELINVLQYQLNSPLEALKVCKRLVEVNPDNGRAWERLARIYLASRKYQEAEKACRESIALSDHSSAWLTLASINERQNRIRAAIEACNKSIEKDAQKILPWIRLVFLHGKNGDSVAAIRAGQHAVKLEPGSAIAWQSLGIALARASRFNEGIEACKKATQIAPTNSSAWSSLARVYEDSAKHDEALRLFEKAISLDSENANTWLSYGVCLDHAGRHTEALAALEKTTDLDPQLIGAWQALCITAGNLGKAEIALEAATQISERTPKDPEGWGTLGIVHSRARRYDSAIRALRKSINLDPKGIRAWRSLILVYNDAGKTNQAKRAARDLTRMLPSEAEAWRVAGQIYNRLGEFDLALYAARKTAELEPKNPDGWYVLGMAQSKVGNLLEALTAFNEATNLDSGHSAAWRGVFARYNELEDHESALLAARKVAELEPENPDSWYILGVAQSKAGNLREAITAYTQATDLDSGHSPAWRNLGAQYNELEDHESALLAARKAAELEPENPDSWYFLGIAKDKAGNLREAITAFTEATNLDSGNSRAWRCVSGIYGKLKDYESALFAARKVAELEPENPDSWYILGIAQSKAGNLREAITAFTEVTNLDPGHSRAWRRVGALYDELEDHESALIAARKAVGLEPDNAAAYYALGHAEYKNGRPEAAIRVLSKAIELNPQHGAAKQLVLLLDAKKAVELQPENADAWYLLGIAEDAKHRKSGYEKAIAAFEKATQLSPDHVRAWERLARIHYHLHQYDLARIVCLRTTELEPANAGNWHGLASNCRHLGRTEDAVMAYEQVLRIGDREYVLKAMDKLVEMVDSDSENREFPALIQLLTRGRKAFFDGAFDDSATQFTRAIEMFPEINGSWYGLQLACEQLSHQMALSVIGKAVIVLQKATNLDSGPSRAWRIVSAIYNKLEDHESALIAARKIAELEPENSDSWYVLGIAQSKAGNTQEAIRALTKAISLNPGHGEALRILGVLHSRQIV